MPELLTAAQMRAAEQAAIGRGAVTSLELMERAGRCIVDAVFEEWPDLQATSHKAVVLCGPGNNGGDGFVVARMLRDWGWAVSVFFHGDAKKLPPDARVNFNRWAKMGETQTLADDTKITKDEPDLIVDALFGIGLSRPINDLTEVVRTLRDCVTLGAFVDPSKRQGPFARVVAVDLPSGICSDSGRGLARDGHEGWAAADLTVTFQTLKLGHVLAEGAEASGKVVVADIGLSAEITRLAKRECLPRRVAAADAG